MRSLICTAIAFFSTNLSAQNPPARPQFEVASVKPSATDDRPPILREMMRNNRLTGRIPMTDPGRIRLENWALLDLIALAYHVRANQVSGPTWISDRDFDIVAKLPEGTRQEELNGMLQSLLEDRFGLKVHRETQTKQGFALVVGKNGPKLKSAQLAPAPDPALTPEEQKAKSQQQAQSQMAAMMKRMQQNRDGDTPLTGLTTSSWSSITTEELAARLVRLAEAPVVDETGLTGKYSVSIETWKSADVPGGTVFDAVQKLGLKLEPRKVTIETIVVDEVSKSPTEN